MADNGVNGNGDGSRASPRRRVIRRSTAAARQQADADEAAMNTSSTTASAPESITRPQRASAINAARAPAPRIAGPQQAAGAGAPPRRPRSAAAAAAGGVSTPPGPATPAGVSPSSSPAPAPVVEAAPPPTMASAAAAAMESAMVSRRALIDRTLFSSMTFSSPLFVNNISQRLLYPTLQRYRQEQKKLLATAGPGGAAAGGGGGGGDRGGTGGGGGGSARGGRADSEAARLLGSDGTSLFGSSHVPMSMRLRAAPTGADGRAGGGDGKGGSAATDYAALAGQLTGTLEEAAEDVRRLLEEEEVLLHREEVRCKRVEIQEKRRLATVRLGLEGTSARLQMYENRVSNAQAATAGIEQHLAQSNARVQRGKSVSQLLRYFKMMTGLSSGELRVLLDSISATRKLQRAAVTTRWESGRVSAFRPRFYTTTVNIAAAPASSNSSSAMNRSNQNSTSASGRRMSASSRLAGAGMEQSTDEDPANTNNSSAIAGARRAVSASRADTTAVATTPAGGKPRVFRRGARRAATSREASVGRGGGGDAVSAGSSAGRRTVEGTPESAMAALQAGPMAGDEEADAEEADPSDDDADDDDDEAGGADGSAFADLTQVRMQRAEAAAVAAGLDRLFALRYCTEAQVEWCQRLTLLATELGDLAKNGKNVRIYVDWLRKELVSDLFHVVTCFNEFYNLRKATAIHQAYGRALLKTLGRISSLYNTLTPSNDELLSTFFKRSINDLGLVLFTEMSPKPLPSAPPLTQPSEFRAMEFYKQNTDKELRKTFTFLLDRIRRDVIIVETIFGTTNTARQQLLSQVTEGVVKLFLSQRITLAAHLEEDMMRAEAALTPRTKRRCGVRVADAIAYHLTMEIRLFSFFQDYIKELKNVFSANEVEFLGRFVDVIFTGRAAYSKQRTELDLLKRYFILIEEKYTRGLHPIPEECFDLREAHMTKMKDIMDRLTEVTTRVKMYALPAEVGPYVSELIKATLIYVGTYIDAELKKVLDSLRTDRDNWRVKPKSEEELLRPPKPESQECALRMLLFAQSSLMSLSDSINVISVPLLQQYPRLVQEVEEARTTALESLDERSERLMNMCVQAILLRSLSILQHYQLKNDYTPKVDAKNAEADSVAPPCTRACTLFCYYITRQFDMASEFIRLSNGQLPQRQTASQLATGGALGAAVQQQQQQQSLAARTAATEVLGGGGAGGGSSAAAAVYTASSGTVSSISGVSAVRARARTMNLQQLIYGDGGPSSFVRTLGVCLYRGISAHLKSYVANDRGALVYKQDVTAYKEAMAPLTGTPGLGGAVVEVLFQMLKETSSLLIMPLDHIKEVKESGTLKLMSAEEKLRYLRIRQDVRAAMKIIGQ